MGIFNRVPRPSRPSPTGTSPDEDRSATPRASRRRRRRSSSPEPARVTRQPPPPAEAAPSAGRHAGATWPAPRPSACFAAPAGRRADGGGAGARARPRSCGSPRARRSAPPRDGARAGADAGRRGQVTRPRQGDQLRQPEGRRREDDDDAQPRGRLRRVRPRVLVRRPRPAGQPDDEPGDRPRQGREVDVRRARPPHPDHAR